MANIIDGKAISLEIRNQVKSEVEKLKAKGIDPGLAVILVGNDPASEVYVRNKKKACEFCGIENFQYNLPENTSESELIELIDKLNNDKKVSGILVQLPLPKQINEKRVTEAISPKKDVDGFCAVNTGNLFTGHDGFVPCTPAGVMELIHSTGVDISGKHAVIVGRSNIVGKPQAILLLREHATVTVCHSKTEDLAKFTRNADILVAAVGKAKFITGDMIKPGSVVIDVGMNRDENGKLCGDVDFESAKDVAGYITPVPGGVGPMTIAMLMKNTLKAAED